jgi:hypothetical protein
VRSVIIVLLAAWPVAGYAQKPATQPSSPKIDIVRVKILDPRTASPPFRLKHESVDLMKGFSLGSFEGLGGVWKVPSTRADFDDRFGRW